MGLWRPIELPVECAQPRARRVELVLDAVRALPGISELGFDAADVIAQHDELALQPRHLGRGLGAPPS